MDDHIRQLQCRACGLQDRADERTQDDDNADAGERAGKTRADDVGKPRRDSAVRGCPVHQRHARHKPQHQRDAHDGKEWVDLPFRDGQDHKDNGRHERKDKRKT